MKNFLRAANILAFAWMAWAIYFSPPFLSYRNTPFPVINHVVKPGQAVQMRVMRCSTDSHTRVYSISHTLVGRGDPIILPASQASIRPGCHESISSVNVIPEGTPPGLYKVKGFGEVNGHIRTHLIEWESEQFEVAP